MAFKTWSFLLTALTFLYTSAEAGSSSCGSCCNLLASRLSASKVARLLDLSYTSQTLDYWSAQEQSLKPACRVTPSCAKDVSTAVSILVQSGCPFAIRGGGHMTFAGAANIDGGVTIDLSGMKDIQVDSARSVVSIGPGCKWGDVYTVCDKAGIAVTGGRVGSVGVGGLLVGGGISFFSSMTGFATDNVVNFEAVLASGEIVNANKYNNTDLYLALRGGGNNFAVVTRFDVASFPSGNVWGGNTYYDASTIPKQMAALEKFVAQSNNDQYASIINSYVYVGLLDTTLVANTFVYAKPTPKPPVYGDFLTLPSSFSSVGVRSLSSVASELAIVSPNGSRQLLATLSFGNSAAFFKKLLDLRDSSFSSVKHCFGFQSAFSLEPIPAIITGRASKSTVTNGNSLLGLNPADGDAVWLCLTTGWAFATDDDAINQAAMSFIAQATALAKASGVFKDYLYLNYALPSQKPLQSYGAANFATMKTVSQKYDPNQVFQKLVPGAFKLSSGW